MVIASLSKMEKVVESNPELMWDGWTVIHSYQSEKARTSKFGALVKGKWHMQRRFEPTEKGWDIPNRFVGGRGQK
jgi:hypothetical protein